MEKAVESERMLNEEHAVNTPHFGLTLQKARQQQRLTIDQIANKLNLSKRYLIALESMNLEELPEPSFSYGFLRSYATLLGLDAQELLLDLKQCYQNHKKSNKLIAPLTTIKKKPGNALLWISFFLSAGVLLTYALKHQTFTKSTTDKNNSASNPSNIKLNEQESEIAPTTVIVPDNTSDEKTLTQFTEREGTNDS